LDTSWRIYISLIVLIALSAFFSASETAFSTVNKIRLKNAAESGSKRAKLALFVAENFDRTLSTILVGNNIVNIASSSLATVLFVSLFGAASGPAISTVVMTILILTFGEVLPKSIAMENSEKLSLAWAKPLRFLMTLFYPVVFLFMKLKQLVIRLSTPAENAPSVTEQELKYIVESIEEEGVLEEQESELVRSALEFDEKNVQEVITPRVDLVAIDADDPPEEIRRVILQERYSRIPVYRDSVDNIIGILHTRDYLEALLQNEQPELEALLQPAFFIYKTKRLSTLLADFKRNKMHIAVVADDYGGTMGIVTMEDLLEQLVGDIWDEDEEVEERYRLLEDGGYQVNGDVPLREVMELCGMDSRTPETGISVSRWSLEQLGRIPTAGEAFEACGLRVTVEKVEDQRITVLHVQKAQELPSGADKI
jgi:putative hemolysin